ncbi:MAG: HEPN domain-containing protein [bacterium]|nr:HEPN domain-containing protein [bacterium]
MNQNNNKKLHQEWFDIADNELNFARAGLEELNAFYPQVCFLCQQSTEKYLKGFLVYSKKKFLKIHDLIQLIKLCAKIDKDFLNLLEKVDILDQYYLVSRYPLEYPPAGKEQAKEALETATNIINFIRVKTNY